MKKSKKKNRFNKKGGSSNRSERARRRALMKGEPVVESVVVEPEEVESVVEPVVESVVESVDGKGKGKGKGEGKGKGKGKGYIPCIFFQKGYCKRGDKCFYRHDEVETTVLKKWHELTDKQKLDWLQKGLEGYELEYDPEWEKMSIEEQLNYLRGNLSNNNNNVSNTNYMVNN